MENGWDGAGLLENGANQLISPRTIPAAVGSPYQPIRLLLVFEVLLDLADQPITWLV